MGDLIDALLATTFFGAVLFLAVLLEEMFGD